jgi:ribosomal protein L37E
MSIFRAIASHAVHDIFQDSFTFDSHSINAKPSYIDILLNSVVLDDGQTQSSPYAFVWLIPCKRHLSKLSLNILKNIYKTNAPRMMYVYTRIVLCLRGAWPPLWSSGQSSWLQIRRPGFDSRHYQQKKSSVSGTGSTQPREYNWEATW